MTRSGHRWSAVGALVLALATVPARPRADTTHLLFTFTRADRRPDLQRKLAVCLGSLLETLRRDRDDDRLVLHLVTDAASRPIAERLLAPHRASRPWLDVVLHDAAEATRAVAPLAPALQARFGGGAFGDPVFFVSIVLHRVLPRDVHRVVKLDVDLLFRASVTDLVRELDRFRPGEVIGLGPDLQPVYYHLLERHRREHPGAAAGTLGVPSPEGTSAATGLPGFNSGVALYDLDAMRRSRVYEAALEPAAIEALAARYAFHGHLGDQDFFTLLGFEHPELFHRLDCRWNRQLCAWWQRVRPDVFDAFHRCDGDPWILHGNCNTPLPGAERWGASAREVRPPRAPAGAGAPHPTSSTAAPSRGERDSGSRGGARGCAVEWRHTGGSRPCNSRSASTSSWTSSRG